jgi:hypothetical protein
VPTPLNFFLTFPLHVPVPASGETELAAASTPEFIRLCWSDTVFALTF